MIRISIFCALLFLAGTGIAQKDIKISEPAKDIAFKEIGEIQPRHSKDIASSNWSIGGETMDRDYTTYKEWKDYLGLTGAKKVRLQAGWAKCEKEKGVYDFEWLDEIIDDVIAQGVEPWLQTSYGNPIYEGGGQIFLSGGFPTSEEALRAWDNWVIALAKRYEGRVKVWEIWNESDLNAKNTADAYSKLFVRTAEIIRGEIPDATIYALSLAGPGKVSYVKSFLDYLKNYDKLHLVDEITVHGYSYRPEDIYGSYYNLNRLIDSYSEDILLSQGELGCPSENQPQYALRNYDWTEMSQSKWLLRKLLGDLGHDFHSLYFTIIDMNYIKRYKRENNEVIELEEPIYTQNTKGIIKANTDNTVAYLKPSFRAYQNITAVFDHSLQRVKGFPFGTNSSKSLSVYGYQSKNYDYQVITIWENGDTPNNSAGKVKTDFDFPWASFIDPVYVEMRTGKVYDIPDNQWKKSGSGFNFKAIPVYDSPILIAEKELVLPTKPVSDSGH